MARNSNQTYKVTPAPEVIVQWCKAIEEFVKLRVKGTRFEDYMRVKVTDCDKKDCEARERNPYCLIKHTVQFRLGEFNEQRKI